MVSLYKKSNKTFWHLFVLLYFHFFFLFYCSILKFARVWWDRNINKYWRWEGKSPPDYNGNFFLILKKQLIWNLILFFFIIHSIDCTFISFFYNFPLLAPKLLILILFCLVVLAALATEFHYSAVLYRKGGFIEQKLFLKLKISE